MPKVEPFYANCSSENCETVTYQVLGSYDRKAHKKKPLPHMKGGLGINVIEPARVPIMGEQPKEYVVSGHGMGIQFRRCHEFSYIDKYSHKHVSDTCTEKRVVNIPQRTLNCYRDVSDLLKKITKKKTGQLTNNIIAIVACSKSGVAPTRVAEPMSPAIVAAALDQPQYTVRKTMEKMIKTGKLATDKPLDVINEKQVRLPQKYQKIFDAFIRGEKAEQIRAGMGTIFGTGTAPFKYLELPQAERFTILKGGFKPPKKTSKKRIEQLRREAEEWKISTGIVPSGGRVMKPSKIKKPPKRKETARYELEQALAMGGHI